MALGALVALCLGATAPVEWSANVTLDARLRTPVAGDLSSVATPELALSPILGAQLNGGTATLQASYTPRLTLIEPTGRHELDVLQMATLAGDWRPSRTWRLHLEELFSRGTTSVSPLLNPALAAGTPADRLPSLDQVSYLGSVTRARVEVELSRELVLAVAPAYLISGGDTPVARTVYPEQRGPRLDASLDLHLSRIDTLEVLAWATDVLASNGPRTEVNQATVAWITRLDARTNLRLEDGWAVYQSVGAGVVDSSWQVAPAGQIQLDEKLGDLSERLVGSVNARLGPVVDPLSGLGAERASGLAGVEVLPLPALRLRASASAGTSLTGPGGPFAQLEGGAGYALTRKVTLAVLGRGGYFSPGTTPASGTGSYQWLASVSLTVVEGGTL